jgi:hypothetical protein
LGINANGKIKNSFLPFLSIKTSRDPRLKIATYLPRTHVNFLC